MSEGREAVWSALKITRPNTFARLSLAINSTGKDGKGATTKVSPWRGQHALNRRRERGIMINKLGKTKDANAGIIVPVEDGPETATPETEGQ